MFVLLGRCGDAQLSFQLAPVALLEAVETARCRGGAGVHVAVQRLVALAQLLPFEALEADPETRAVILTGAGKAFCAGLDLKELGSGASTVNGTVTDKNPVTSIGHFSGPVIGAINAPAVGFGASVILPMDIRVCSSAASFGYVFVRRGIVAESCSSWFLPRLVGIQQALEWCYTGRVFPAQEALEGRLVSKVVPADELMPAARALAREIVDHTAPVSIALIRQMMWRMLGADDPMEAHKIDSRGIYARGASADVREGVTAFLEKRPARFTQTVSNDMPSYFPWWDERPYE